MRSREATLRAPVVLLSFLVATATVPAPGVGEEPAGEEPRRPVAAARATGAVAGAEDVGGTGLVGPANATLVDTGRTETNGTAHDEETAAELSHPLVDASALRSAITLQDGAARASTNLTDLRLDVPGEPLLDEVRLEGLSTTAEANCTAASGTTRIRGLAVEGILPLEGEVTPPPNTGINLTDGVRVVLNEQREAPGADRGRVVHGVHMEVEGATDVVVGRSEASVDDCPSDDQTTEAPTASFDHVCDGLSCRFNASDSRDPNGTIVSYEWDFGDGNTSTGEVVNHTYGESGNYTVVLTVTDDDGLQDTERRNVTVTSDAITGCDAVVSDGESIQVAVDAVEAGDAVCIEDGSYREEVTVNKTLTLTRATGNATPTLEGATDLETGLLVQDANGTVVEGLAVRNYTTAGIQVETPNVTVESTTVEGLRRGIYVSDTSDFTVRNTTVRGPDRGIRVVNTEGVHVEENTVEQTGFGFDIVVSSDIQVVNNTGQGNRADVFLSHSERAEVTDNRLESGVTLRGNTHAEFDHQGQGNTVQGEPLVFLNGARHEVVDAPAGQVILVDAENVTVRDLALQGVWNPVQVAFSSDVEVRDINVTDSIYGMTLRRNDGTLVQNVTLAGNERAGIRSLSSQAPTIAGNAVDGHWWEGVLLRGTDDAVVEDNHLTGNERGVRVTDADDAALRGNNVSSNLKGVEILGSDRALLENNTVADNGGTGVVVAEHPRGGAAENATLRSNEIRDNFLGIRVSYTTPGAEVHQNNIYNNTDGVGLNATETADQVDATENWWGCPDGPDDPACDDVDGNAVYDPWLTSRNPDAGA